MANQGCLIKKASNQSGSNYTASTVIAWDAEIYDTYSCHDTVTNNSRITVPSILNGFYGFLTCTLQIDLGNPATGQPYLLSIIKGGSLFAGQASSKRTFENSSHSWISVCSHPVLLATADYFEVSLFCPDTLTIIAANSSFGLWVPPGSSRAFKGVSVHKSGTQSGANYSSGAVVAWDAEDYDTDTIHDAVTNNSRLTIPSALNGELVIVGAQMTVQNQGAGTNSKIVILKNGSDSYDGVGGNSITTNAAIGNDFPLARTQPIQVATADYFEAFYTSSDTSIDITTASSMWLYVVGSGGAGAGASSGVGAAAGIGSATAVSSGVSAAVGSSAGIGSATAVSVGSGDTVWAPLKIGGGGYIPDLVIAADGTKFAKTDTYGAWYFDASAPNPGNAGGTGSWQQVVTINSMPVADCGIGFSSGVYAVAIAPSNTSRFAMMFNGYLYLSDNKGTNWTRTAFSQVTATANTNPNKTYSPYLAFDPANADVLYVSSPSGGLFVTTNAGASFSAVAAVGSGTNTSGGLGGGHLIAFDPTSSVVSTKTQGIYVSTFGTGVYHSTNGGSSWTLTTSTPTTHVKLICDQNGTVWLVTDDDGGAGGTLHKYTGTWSTISAATTGGLISSVAVNPANGANIVVQNGGGSLNISSNTGSTWTGLTTTSRVATDIPWLQATNENFLASGQIAFDPSQSNRLYTGYGIGISYTTPPTTNVDVVWTSQAAAIEQLVSNWVVSPPTGNPIVTFWDKPVFTVSSLASYPSDHGVNYTNNLESGWSCDYAAPTPSTIVVIANTDVGATDTSGISSDGGATWTPFATRPTEVLGSEKYGGCIAAASATNFLWLPSNNVGHPYYTTDAGANWNAITIAGIATSGTTGWGFAAFLDRQACWADRVNANTFYLYNDGGSGAGTEGVYKSTNSGASWAHVFTGHLGAGGSDSFNLQGKSVPTVAGNAYVCAGTQGSPPTLTGALLYESTDSGVTWNSVANVSAFCFGIGKAKPGGSGYPAVYFVGYLSSVLGIYRSDDHCSTWTKIGDGFPDDSFDQIRVIEGDNNTWGTVYAGFGGSGFAYGSVT